MEEGKKGSEKGKKEGWMHVASNVVSDTSMVESKEGWNNGWNIEMRKDIGRDAFLCSGQEQELI